MTLDDIFTTIARNLADDQLRAELEHETSRHAVGPNPKDPGTAPAALSGVRVEAARRPARLPEPRAGVEG